LKGRWEKRKRQKCGSPKKPRKQKRGLLLAMIRCRGRNLREREKSISEKRRRKGDGEEG